MNKHSSPTWPDYRAAVTRLNDAIDAVLEQGRTAQKRYEHLARLRDDRLGPHRDAFLELDRLPLDHRHVQRRLLQLTENLYHTFLGPTPKAPGSLARTAPRALGSRNRI